MSISLIIFTYNRADYLRRALQSVENQTTLPDEIIVIDDGSTDNTHTIIEEFNLDIIYEKIEHSGAPIARNRGIEIASSKFILWLGDDDTLSSSAISSYKTYIEEYPEVDIFYCNYNLISDSGETSRLKYNDWYYDRRGFGYHLIYQAGFGDSGSVVKKDLYAIYGNYNEQFSRAQDYEFWSRIAFELSITLKLVPKPLLNYRVDGANQLSGGKSLKDFSFDVAVVDRLIKRGYSDEILAKIVGDQKDQLMGNIAIRYLKLNAPKRSLQYLSRVEKKSSQILDLINSLQSKEQDIRELNLPIVVEQNVDKNHPITIFMVTYNQIKYIREAVNSVLNQTFYHFDFIIVDDGSTDGTVEYINSIGDHRVRVVKQPHKGFAAGMNLAIKESRTPLLLGVDSDDIITRDYLAKLIYFTKKYPQYDYYYPELLTLMDEDGVTTGEVWEYKDYNSSEEITQHLFSAAASVIPNSGSIKRRTIYEKLGFFDEIETCEDYRYLAKHGKDIKFKRCDKLKGYLYRRHGSSNSQKSIARCRLNSETMGWMVSNLKPKDLLPEGNSNLEDYIREVFISHANRWKGNGGEYFLQFVGGDRKDNNSNNLSIGIIAQNNNLAFMDNTINYLKGRGEVTIYDADQSEDLAKAYRYSDIIWLEWCDLNLAQISKLQKGPKLIARCHSYEAYLPYLEHIEWDKVDKTIFISPQIMEYVKNKVPRLKELDTLVYQSEGINLDRFKFKKRTHGFNLAFVGHLTQTKNISLLLQIIKKLTSVDSRYRLDIFGKFALDGGSISKEIPERYFHNLVERMDLEGNITLHGHLDQDEMIKIMENTNYLLSTSYREGLPFNVLEGMSMGIKPIIHSWPGAEQCFDEKFIFSYIDEVLDMVKEEYNSLEYREFIEKNHNLENYFKFLDRVI